MTEESQRAALDLADRFWDRLLEFEPMVGTEVGDERFDDRLPDPSEEGLATQRAAYQEALEELRRIDPEGFDETTRTTLDVLDAICRLQLGSIEHRTDRFYAVSHMFGPGALLADIGALQRADTPERLERFVARLSAFPTFLRELSSVAAGAARVGQVVPALVVDRTIGQVERLLAGSPEESPAMKPVAKSSSDERDRVRDVIRDTVYPAYQGYLEALRRYRPSARDTIGLSALDGGEAIYAHEILANTTLTMKPEDVHRIGQAQLEKIQDERARIAADLGYRNVESCLEEYQASGRNTAPSREAMIQLVRNQVERGWDTAPRFFGRLPRANCEVRMVEEFREHDMPGAFYLAPTADGSRPGIYYVNTSDLPERPLHHTATTSYHEANPGHHFQLSIEQEYSDRPRLRRFGSAFVGVSFVEGWALYSERLADEMGVFQNEYERLGMLEAQGLRAGRLIVDTGIHALGWDRERCVQQLIETGAPKVDAEIETDRYIAMPGQALAYMIGQLQIQAWRRKAEERQGSDFDLKAFHDRLLELGSLPLETLGRELGDGVIA
jgi:uncharacterized protein (DUF885 family)